MEALNINTEDHQLKNKIEVIRSIAANRQVRALILLVLLDEKPVSVFTLKSDQVAEVLGKCKSIGLPVLIIKELKEEEYGDISGFQMAVSKSEKFINEIYEIVQKGTDKLDHERYGELMGFPETAIQTYLENDPTKQISLDEYLKITEKFIHLFGFKISKEHATEEINVLERWYSIILQNAPELIT